MNIRTATSATLTGLLSLALSSLAFAQEGMVWNDINSGTLAGSAVAITNIGSTSSVMQNDFSTSNFSCAPLSSTQDSANYGANENWTATFTPPISNGLLWYGIWIRGAGAYAGGGPVDYTFNHPPTILCGFSAGSVSGNTFSVPESGFHHGVLSFPGAVGTLTCTTNATGISFQGFTLGQMGPLEPGTAYCFGDPGSGTACPCGNDNDGSVPGSGCANGIFASGAQLTGSGVASLGADTLVLATTGLEPSNSGLYFQANNDLSPGNIWGDGLQCAGGQLKRLGVRFSDATGYSDTSGYPQPISVKAGNILAGDTKYYQCWYRNPTSSPCGSDFNASNGYAITWLP